MRRSLDLKGNNIGATRHAPPAHELLSQMDLTFGALIMTLVFRRMSQTGCVGLRYCHFRTCSHVFSTLSSVFVSCG
ncbi:hypothetical protein LINGRAHAP2_LOCUS30256, partial [Linum grandiflorum]